MSTNPSVDFPWAAGLGWGELPVLDIVAIVTEDRAGKRMTRRMLVPERTGQARTIPGDMSWFRIDETRAEVGKGVKSGERLVLCSPVELDVPDRLTMRPGQRYLVLGLRPKDGRFTINVPWVVRSASQWPNPDLSSCAYEAAEKNEVSAVMVFPTEERKLPEQMDGTQLRLSIVRSLNPKDDDSYRRVVRFLAGSGSKMKRRTDPGIPDDYQIEYTPPNSVTEALLAELPRSSGYQRSKIWELLLRWRVPGSLVGYLQSLQKLARDPKAYSSPLGEEPMNLTGLANVDPFPQFSQPDWLNIVSQGTNESIVVFFLENTEAILNEAGQKRLAARLTDSNRRIRYGVAAVLSDMNKDPKHYPFLYNSDDFNAPIFEYWRQFYHLKE